MNQITSHNRKLFEKAKALGLPAGEYVIVGSGPLGVRGLREMSDIDIMVSDTLWQDLAKDHTVITSDVPKIILAEDVECFSSLSFPARQGWPTSDEQLAQAEEIDGLFFQSLHHALLFKSRSDREKDSRDVELLKDYLFERRAIKVRSGGVELPGSLVVPRGEVKSAVLFFPGGGNTRLEEGPALAGRKAWQERLAGWGVASLAFDYRGIEGAGVGLNETSLATRSEDAIAAYDALKEAIGIDRVFAIGVSMGAVAAVQLSLDRELTGVCLVCPAAFSLAAHTIPFGPDFTVELRKDDDQSQYLDFDLLRQYKGKLLLAYGGKDLVIPTQIIETYKNIVSSKDGVVQVHPDAAHFMNKEDPASLDAQRALALELKKFLTSS